LYRNLTLTGGGAVAISIRLDEKTERRLERLAKATGRTKTWFVRQAVNEYLEEWEDYHIAMSRLEHEKEEIDIEEVRRRLGLAD
jgi:RHH-type rel operon transcriptional repressor/antitoxin RelB